MSLAPKYKIGDKINEWIIINHFKGEKCAYLCKCSCGSIFRKDAGAINKNKCCKKCRGKYSRNPPPLLFNKGDFVNNWEIIGIDRSKRNLRYKCKCNCGKICTKVSYIMKRDKQCRDCNLKEKNNRKKGETVGNFTIIKYVKEGKKTRPFVKCNRCSNMFLSYTNSLKTRNGCANCIRGFFPGKVLDGITLVRSLGKGLWEAKCLCGKIFKSLFRKYKGGYTGCGCQRPNRRMVEAKKKIGSKFGYLTVKKILPSNGKHLIVELKCKCGNTIKRPNGNEFKSMSCGCKWHTNSLKGEDCHFSKLNEVDVISLRQFYDSGLYSNLELSRMFDISERYIEVLIKKKRWKHI